LGEREREVVEAVEEVGHDRSGHGDAVVKPAAGHGRLEICDVGLP
jgi:hypothetical protein